MSKLSEFLNGRKEKTVVVEKKKENNEPIMYNRAWLRKMSNRTGFIISSDDKKVDGILAALNRKNGHCPCGGNGPQFICPCVIMREQGICKCGLYENVKPVEPKGTSGGQIKENTNE